MDALATSPLSLRLAFVAPFALVAGLGCSGGSGGGVTPDPDGSGANSCSEGCESGQRCVDEVCTPVEQLYVSLGETAFEGDRPAIQRAQVVSYAPVRDAAVDERSVLAQSGDCTLYGLGNYLAAHEAGCGDWGTIEVSGVSPLAYDCTDGVANVFTEGEGLLEAGSPLTVSGSGGAVFPAFSADLVLPARVTGSFSAIEKGAAIEVTWNAAGGSGANVALTTIGDAGASKTVICVTDDSGSIVIDPTITTHFPATITTWFGSITRWDNTPIQAEGAEVAIDIGVYADLRLNNL